jgi:hypothetical protein
VAWGNNSDEEVIRQVSYLRASPSFPKAEGLPFVRFVPVDNSISLRSNSAVVPIFVF